MDESEDDYLWNECEEAEGKQEDVDEHHHGTLIRMCHKNNGKNCLETVKMKKKTILEVFRCYLMVVENENQNKNFVLFFEPE